ncbi:MAG: hypothetical protein GWM98_25485 [Nitrospinaceae bacterium]|nr:hypothetical protein [Nitrospinaceae bacterium]NIR57212.1 hypothetical protein [Nitrospinaceae bacterium]NIS87655.1 hypothetical protein [Nitrospinaceae bacterium]NIT84521.1 hypothetical protein [Nitrospinaceae bacterium]NIU46712.1 hypothetical protein [Nitrospinaceae bacterium]
MKFKENQFDAAEELFEKASQSFQQAERKGPQVQLHLTVTRMQLVAGRKEPADVHLDKAREIVRELGDPEELLKIIQELEKIKDAIDKR